MSVAKGFESKVQLFVTIPLAVCLYWLQAVFNKRLVSPVLIYNSLTTF